MLRGGERSVVLGCRVRRGPPDFSEANAFLLGLDLRGLAPEDDAVCIERFLSHFLLQDEGKLDPDDFAGKVLRGRLYAFERGFKGQ